MAVEKNKTTAAADGVVVVENGGGDADAESVDFSDEEGYKDDIPEEELVGDILLLKPTATEVEDSCVIVDGVPKVEEDRLPKLKTVLNKIWTKIGPIKSEEYPIENGKTKGYCFIEYANPKSAQEAILCLDGYKLDKAHTFSANSFADLDNFASKPDENWKTPETRPYKAFGNPKWWLENNKGRDQYIIQYGGTQTNAGEKVAVFWNKPNDPENKPVVIKDRWTEATVQWSPRGTYIATYHTKGVALWAGPNFEQIARFPHENVRALDFSPCENYIVTYCPPQGKYKETAEAVRIYEIRTQELKRAFSAHRETVTNWPYFKWSFDGSFFACSRNNTLSIYETPSFALLDKKPVRIEELQNFAWSPKQRYLAY